MSKYPVLCALEHFSVVSPPVLMRSWRIMDNIELGFVLKFS